MRMFHIALIHIVLSEIKKKIESVKVWDNYKEKSKYMTWFVGKT